MKFLTLLSLFIFFSCSDSKSSNSIEEKQIPQLDSNTVTESITVTDKRIGFDSTINRTFIKEKFKAQFADTIQITNDYENKLIKLDSIDYFNIYNKTITINESTRFYFGFYFHSLIIDTDSLKQITLLSWQDGGYSSIDLITILPDTTYSFLLAEAGDEESSYSVFSDDTLTRYYEFTPMGDPNIQLDSTNIRCFYDITESSINKYQITGSNPFLISTINSKEVAFREVTEGFEYSNRFEKVNEALKGSKFYDLASLKDSVKTVLDSFENEKEID